MYSCSGTHFDRFGEAQEIGMLDSRKRAAEDTPSIDVKLLKLQDEINADVKELCTRVEDNLKKHVVGSVKSELADSNKLARIFDIIESTDPKVHSSLAIKNHRRISKVSKATDQFDVVVKAQLDDAIKAVKNEFSSMITLLSNTVEQHTTSVNNKFQALDVWKYKCSESIQELYEKTLENKQIN